MKNLLMGALSAFGLIAILSGCGSSSAPVDPVVAASTATTCQAGYIYSTTYSSCLQQTATCSGTSGMYNNTCVYAGVNPTIGATGAIGGIGGTGTTAAMCATQGMVNTSGGCLPQGVCRQGYGFGSYQGQPWCYPVLGY